MIIVVAGLAITLMESDDRVCMHTLNGGGYERESLQAWASMVQPGDVALDIGAYTGLYSIVAAKRGAQALAFEPMPANRWRLGVNAAANKAAVTVFDCAVSDKVGTATLHYNPRVPLTTGASLEKNGQFHRDSFEVGCMTLDALLLPRVAAIKIDVERHEASVLRGAAHTIARDRPLLLIETLDDAARDEVLALLPDYKVDAVLDKRNSLVIPN